MSSKTIDHINSLLYRSASFTDPVAMRNCSRDLPFVIMPIADDNRFWVLNQSGNILGHDHNHARDTDMVHADELDLSSLVQEADGNYYLWDTIPPDSMASAMAAYRNLLGQVFKASHQIMNGNRGTPRKLCYGGARA